MKKAINEYILFVELNLVRVLTANKIIPERRNFQACHSTHKLKIFSNSDKKYKQ